MIEQVATDWHIDPQITFKEWKEAGRKLALVDNTLQWHWGEWWNHGHKKWDREAEEFIKELPLKRATLHVYGSVCNAVKPLTRIKDLPFKHHQLIAPMHEDPKEQKMWLKRAKKNKWPVSQLREAIQEAYKEPDPPLPKGKFNVIYADPPWCYGDKRTGFGGAEDHYPSMTVDDLCAMDIPVDTDAVLFLWVTSPILGECWPIITAWGFQYKASFVWDKVRHVLGHYNSVRHEFLLICTRGSFLPKDKTLHDSVVSIERTKHSEKPDYFRKLIEKMYPDGKKLELFGRKQVKGWTVYGNEAGVV